jgi:UDP-N-acetylglucosamine 3-dehydrogenase
MKRAIVVGLGVMGGYHLRVLGQVDGVEVVGGVDSSPERRAAARMPAFATVSEALRELRPDFACIAAPAAAMPALAAEALEAGVPVMVEKPVAADEADALRIVEQARAAGLLLAVGHVERCNPAVIAMKHKLDAGAIGAIYQLHARRLSPFPDRDSMLGVALDLATHDIDVMRYLTGSEVARVFAETERRLHDRAEDLIAATLRFDGGATGLLEVNWLTPTKVRELTVTGERGTFVLNYLTQELSHYQHPTQRNEWDALASMRGGGEGDMVRYALERREPLRVQWEAFLAALENGGEAMATGWDGYAAMSTARAIQRAGREHRVVTPAYRS